MFILKLKFGILDMQVGDSLVWNGIHYVEMALIYFYSIGTRSVIVSVADSRK